VTSGADPVEPPYNCAENEFEAYGDVELGLPECGDRFEKVADAVAADVCTLTAAAAAATDAAESESSENVTDMVFPALLAC
jgi:hypothetical protein